MFTFNPKSITMKIFLLYIDPGSGSLLLQILAGGALAAGMFMKTYWEKVKFLFRRVFKK
jgi:hypothetical protein